MAAAATVATTAAAMSLVVRTFVLSTDELREIFAKGHLGLGDVQHREVDLVPAFLELGEVAGVHARDELLMAGDAGAQGVAEGRGATGQVGPEGGRLAGGLRRPHACRDQA